MKKAPDKRPPVQEAKQHDYVKTAIRLPFELHQELKRAAESSGRSLNAEILARLQSGPLDTITADIVHIKAELRKILDAVT